MTLDFGQTELAITESVAANVSERDVVVVQGPDAASFLQGQMSQNVEQLQLGASAWSFLLQPQGKVAAWGRITRVGAEEFWFDVDLGFGAVAAQRLQRFLLRVKCTIEVQTWPLVQLRGPGTPELPGAIETAWRGSVIGRDLIGPEVSVPQGIEVGDPLAFESQRIALGIPMMGSEITEATIPNEVGVVDVSADFNKGCYVGQELVARVDSRGNNTPRRLERAAGSGSPPAIGASIVVAESEAGVLTSVAPSNDGWVGLASIKRGTEVPGVGTLDGQPVRIGSTT